MCTKFESVPIVAVSQGLMCLSCVRKLRLGVALADSHQRSDLVQVLWRLTNLEDLGIWVLYHHILVSALFFLWLHYCGVS